jgi:hypothetical protein
VPPSVKIRGKQEVKGFLRVSAVKLDVRGHNGTHTFVPRANILITVREGILIMDENMRVLSANHSFLNKIKF